MLLAADNARHGCCNASVTERQIGDGALPTHVSKLVIMISAIFCFETVLLDSGVRVSQAPTAENIIDHLCRVV